jgi:hypothetical protein
VGGQLLPVVAKAIFMLSLLFSFLSEWELRVGITLRPKNSQTGEQCCLVPQEEMKKNLTKK